MRQKQVSTPAGRFWPCSQCHNEPRYIVTSGRNQRETMQRDIPAIRHSLECRCGRSTGLHASLASAEADWGRRFTQIPLALPAPAAEPTPRRVVDLRRRRREVAHG